MMLMVINKYLFSYCNSFSRICYGVPPLYPPGGEMMEIIIFMIGTYSFNIFSIIKAINVLSDDWR